MKPLVIIPARGGSKGIPQKNIKPLNGKPLIYYTIEVAREIFEDKLICVSTDDIKIKSVVEKIGLKVPFIRPAELSTDTADTYKVLLHAVDYFEQHDYFPDVVVLLQVTSPFRNSSQIKEAIELFDENCEMVVSVNLSTSNPYYNLFEEDSRGWLTRSKSGNFVRRQDCPNIYELNGAIYVISVKALKEKSLTDMKRLKKYVMSKETSHDIDIPLDWDYAEFILQRKNK